MLRLSEPYSLAILALALSLATAASACRDGTLSRASSTFIERHDYASLEVIAKELRTGMLRSEVRRLLGEPDYSPTEGQDYYSSDKKTATDDGRTVVVGLVVDYRNAAGDVSDRLQSAILGPLDE